jgi:hypothetical protein
LDYVWRRYFIAMILDWQAANRLHDDVARRWDLCDLLFLLLSRNVVWLFNIVEAVSSIQSLPIIGCASILLIFNRQSSL